MKTQNPHILLITPPFTQLNTPYPATAYLKGFLNSQKISNFQADLGLEVTLALFSKSGLQHVFSSPPNEEASTNVKRIYELRHAYIHSIEPTIAFLQGNDATLAHKIAARTFLPEALRFEQLDYLEWAFGNLGVNDAAKHIATLYLEDLADYINSVIDPHFGFSRYAEKLALAIPSFTPIHTELQAENSLVDQLLIRSVEKHIQQQKPSMVALSVPFPGNLYGALKCGQHIKQHHPNITVVMGGGYPNTELRSMTEKRIFQYVDYITLDDGERPFMALLDCLSANRNHKALKRTYYLKNDEVVYANGAPETDFSHQKKGTPSYQDLLLNKYISVLEQTNPMHRLWTDGRWNKLTLAHGCYWGKCTFCDTSLDYIGHYEPANANFLVNQIVQIVNETGNTGFHFVDEAAPPSLLRDLSLELIKQDVQITWWANIRFEKSFTADLCYLMQKAGCIAVSGGLEVASDRLLKLIKKGVSIKQVTEVTHSFKQANILVHAYLMYGFPTQTTQETIDSLEVVRQLFEAEVIQSGFWHQFSMTAHSPIGISPESFQVSNIQPTLNSFANNDLIHEDLTGASHSQFSDGLKTSLFNYMNQSGFEYPLKEWFEFNIPKTTISKTLIQGFIAQSEFKEVPINKNLHAVGVHITNFSKKNNELKINFATNTRQTSLVFTTELGQWILTLFKNLDSEKQPVKLIKSDFEEKQLGVFILFWSSKEMEWLKKNGLLCL